MIRDAVIVCLVHDSSEVVSVDMRRGPISHVLYVQTSWALLRGQDKLASTGWCGEQCHVSQGGDSYIG